MARNIGADGRDVYRAAITRNRDGSSWYEGPYSKPGAARARVSFWRNYFTDPETGEPRVTGHIEQADTVWRPLDDQGNPAPAPRRVLTDDEWNTAYTTARRNAGTITAMYATASTISDAIAGALASVGILAPPFDPGPPTCTAMCADDDGEWWQCEDDPGHQGGHDCGDLAWSDEHPDAIPPRTE